jgi:N-acetyl-1-D-myo-inositol-2-amino-2-deoxy-alpha-D-glucopyranoside deacetylase
MIRSALPTDERLRSAKRGASENLRASRSVVFVHAHPDDESLATGGTIARYAAEGAHVCLVTCTNGEVGEIAEVPGLGSPEEIRPRLGEIRKGELAEACRILGPVDLRVLGYHDSGMESTPENEASVAFVNQDIDEVVAKIVAILEDVRPQVLVTYNEYGAYGHPDHIRAHRAGVRAAAECGVAKVYYTAFPKSLLRAAGEMFGEAAEIAFTDEEIERIGTPDEDITTVIDVSAYVGRKFEALAAHRTQLGTTAAFLQIPDDVRAAALGAEHYVLVRSTVDAPEREFDLFEGVVV